LENDALQKARMIRIDHPMVLGQLPATCASIAPHRKKKRVGA